MKWINASERLSGHMENVIVRKAGYPSGLGSSGYYDWSRKVYMVANMGPQGWKPEEVEWLDEQQTGTDPETLTPESQWPTEVEIEKAFIKFRDSQPGGLDFYSRTAWKAAIQWLQTSGVREGTEKELRECLGELVQWYEQNYKTEFVLIEKAKSLLNPYKEKPSIAGDLYGGA